ncbi:MAG: hypothetical protein KA354_09840 [Phycisphaerae bacterium]|nr:hypothetical protein [Phycisphaerae bacterium]
MIRVQCPHCHRRYRTMTEAMGKTAVCTGCNESFRIGEQRVPFQWKETDLGEDSWIGVPAPKEKKEYRQCFMCDAPMEPGMVRCPECGANQVTGVVQKTRTQEEVEARPSLWSKLPTRWLVVSLTLLALGGGVYAVFSWTRSSANRMADQMADERLVARVAALLSRGADDLDLAAQFAGQVTDENLDRYLVMLTAREEHRRRAVTALIGCGRIRQIGPILKAAEAETMGTSGRRILELMGPRRLVELACDPAESIRETAAAALCRISDIQPSEDTLRKLAAPATTTEKTHTLNLLCRPWPQATGTFQAVVGEERSPFLVQVNQVGRTFYLRTDWAEFATVPGRQRLFEIPIERWCAATGPAVDVTALRQMLAGSVTLSSPVGVGWEGTILLRVKQAQLDRLPGFLPFQPPRRERDTEVPIRLERGR